MSDHIYVVEPIHNEPYRERFVGRVTILQCDEYLQVYLDRLGEYYFTNDAVYGERAGHHIFSSWPLVYDALKILRAEMILDDLSSA